METEILHFIQGSPASAYLVVFAVLLACGLGLPVPEDITLIVAGYTVYLAGQNHLTQPKLIPMIGVGLCGVLAGDVILFVAGRWLGGRAARIWPFRLFASEARLEKVHGFFSRYGAWTAFIARFAAGLRAPTYLLAGTAGLRFRTFILADGSAALLSVPLLVWLAWHFGAEIERVERWLSKSRYAVLAAVVTVVAIFVVRKLKQRRRAGVEGETPENELSDRRVD